MLIPSRNTGFNHPYTSEITPRAVYEDRRRMLKLMAGGAAGAVYYLREMVVQKRWCAYCLVSAAGMFAIAAMTARGLSATQSSRAGGGGGRDRHRLRAPRR